MRYGLVKSGVISKLTGGVMGLIQAGKDRKRGRAFSQLEKAQKVEEVDYTQARLADELRRKMVGQQSGSTAAVGAGLGSVLSGVTDAATALGAGGGADLATMLRSQNTVANQYNQALAQQEQSSMASAAMYQQEVGNIAQRRMELGMAERLRSQAQEEAYKRSARENLTRGVGLVAGAVQDVADIGTRGFLGVGDTFRERLMSTNAWNTQS